MEIIIFPIINFIEITVEHIKCINFHDRKGCMRIRLIKLES